MNPLALFLGIDGGAKIAKNLSKNVQRFLQKALNSKKKGVPGKEMQNPAGKSQVYWQKQKQKLDAMNQERQKMSNFAQKETNKFSKKPVLPVSPMPSVNKPQPLNVGGQLNTFKKKQNKAIAKGLKNPINYEQKIKNIMGVN